MLSFTKNVCRVWNCHPLHRSVCRSETHMCFDVLFHLIVCVPLSCDIFDISLCSFKGDEDEDEVFLGPVSHKERCVSVNMESRLEDLDGGVRASLSPLTEDQLESVCQEALKLATQLQNSDLSLLHREVGKTTKMTTDNTTTHREDFVQDKVAKLNLLGQTASALSPIKRQTFCVQDSPMKELPPAVQRRLLRGSSANVANSVPTNKPSSTRHTSINAALFNRPASTASSKRLSSTASSTRPTTRLSTSSPVAVAKAQPRMALRGKVALGVGVVLPSKPAAPPTSCLASKSRAEKTRLQPPSKVGEMFDTLLFRWQEKQSVYKTQNLMKWSVASFGVSPFAWTWSWS